MWVTETHAFHHQAGWPGLTHVAAQGSKNSKLASPICIYFPSLCIKFANILLAKTNHMAKQIQGLGKEIPLLEVRGESGGHFCNLPHIAIMMTMKPQLHRDLDVVISLTSHELPNRPLHHPTYTMANVLFGSPRSLRR